MGPAWAGGAVKPVSLKIPVCPGNQPNNHDLTITGHAESTLTLESAGLQIDSDVLVFASPAQVAKLAKRVLRPVSLLTCLRFNLLKQVAGQGVTIVGVSQLRGQAGDGAQLYRVTLVVKSNGQTLSVFNDFLFVSKGRSQFFVSVVAPSSEKGRCPSGEPHRQGAPRRVQGLTARAPARRIPFPLRRLRAPVSCNEDDAQERSWSRYAHNGRNGHAIYTRRRQSAPSSGISSSPRAAAVSASSGRSSSSSCC
jgi:hypothetical protein